MKRKVMVVAGLFGTVALGVAACGSSGASDADGRIPVVASTNAWASVVSAIGGDEVSVNALIDSPSADPHSYESTAEDALDVTESKLVLVNGGGYDDFALKLAEQAPDVPAINAFELSGHGEDEPADEGEHAEDEHGHDHAVNEHVWYDLHTVTKVAEAVEAQLSKIEPGSAEKFRANAATFTKQLAAVDKDLHGLGEGKKVLAFEPVAHYLIEAAELTDVTPAEFGNAIEGDSDVPVAAQDAVDQLVEGKKVAVVINNPQTATDVTDELVDKAADAGIPVVDVAETLPEGVTDYVKWVRAEVAELKAALAR